MVLLSATPVDAALMFDIARFGGVSVQGLWATT